MNGLRLSRLQALGVSVGPFATRSDESDVVDYLRRFDRIVVRDLASLALCRHAGLECSLGLDPALLLDLPDPGWRRKGRPSTLGVVIAETDGAKVARPHEPEKRLVNLVSIIARMRDTPTLRVICLNPRDVPVTRRLMAGIAERVGRPRPSMVFEDYAGDPTEAIRAIGDCDALLTVRLHGAVFAYMCEVPFVLADYHEKCRSFAATVGAPEEWIADSDFSDVEVLSRQLDTMLSGGADGPVLGVRAARQEARAAYAGTLESWNGRARLA
jgi:polysaccharide pyruvyl transferase WcaK-like protein